MLAATEERLQKIHARVQAGRLAGKDTIGVAAGKVVNRYKVSKHFALTITDDAFRFARIPQHIDAEAALDGLYIMRTSVNAERMDAATCVRTYKSLAQVERAFLSMKMMDLKVLPIHHHLEGRVRAHLLVCLLAYYVEWDMREVWRALMCADEDQAAKRTRDPVAPAKRSEAARKQVARRTLDVGRRYTVSRRCCRTCTPSCAIRVARPRALRMCRRLISRPRPRYSNPVPSP